VLGSLPSMRHQGLEGRINTRRSRGLVCTNKGNATVPDEVGDLLGAVVADDVVAQQQAPGVRVVHHRRQQRTDTRRTQRLSPPTQRRVRTSHALVTKALH
jgi:hypothetical protein